jgi:hypothetical protein
LAAEAEAEAEAEADVHYPVPGSEESEPVKMLAMLFDQLATAIAELHADLLDDLKGTLKTQLKDMRQGLLNGLEHEISARNQFEQRTRHAFVTLNESLQASLDEMEEDLAKRARERPQKAWEQLASNSTTTTSPADMVVQAAQVARTAANATCRYDAVPVAPSVGGRHSQEPAQAPMQETVQQPQRQLVSMEDTLTCGRGDGAAGPRPNHLCHTRRKPPWLAMSNVHLTRPVC